MWVERPLPKVSIYTDSSGEPGTSLYVLSRPQSVQSGSVNTFTAEDSVPLSAKTIYWVVFENESTGSTSASHYRLRTSNSDDEDSGEASGWSIADERLFRVRDSSSWLSRSAELRIAIEGTINPDPTLSSLELQDPEGDPATLVPPLSYETYDYTAYVDYSVDGITLTVSSSDDDATLEYMDRSGGAITDGDSVKDGLQFSLGEGGTKVQIRVTAADGVASITYTVIVTRLPEAGSILVSNKGEPTASNRLPDMIAQAFRTGPYPHGYRLHSVEFDLDSTSSDRLVRIAPRKSNVPNPDLSNPAEIITLSNPDTIVSGYNKYTVPPDTTLSPKTIYYIVITNSAGSAGPGGNALYTLHNDDDAGGAKGWRVENHRLTRVTPADEWRYIPSKVKISVNGHTFASRDTRLGDVRVTDAEGNPLALRPAFRSNRFGYSLSVPKQVDEITLTTVARHFNATFYYRTPFHYPIRDGNRQKDGHQVGLAVGRNSIEIVVTAENGYSTHFYELEVTRSAVSSDASLTALGLTYDADGIETAVALDPAFDSGTYSYTAGVAYPMSEITVAATRNDDTAAVFYLDGGDQPIADADGEEEGHQVSLAVGENTIKVRVIAEDGEPVLTYTLVASRDDECRSGDDSDACTVGFSQRPGISVPSCRGNGVFFFWHTGNRGEAEAPEGWKIERRQRDSEGWVVRTFSFIGPQADTLRTDSEEYWEWVDESAKVNVRYTYRVRAINADGSDLDGRFWSRRAPAEC